MRKFQSSVEGTHNQIDMKVFSRPRSRSISESKCDNIKFSDTIDLQNPDIHPEYRREWGCAAILIVDDQFINRFIILQFAEQYDVNWDEAEDGEEAVNLIKLKAQNKCCKGYSLVLMDLNMPIMGGIEATKAIIELKKKWEVSQDLSIVAVTAFASETEKEKCLSVGMSDFIPKPFTISEFLYLWKYK